MFYFVKKHYFAVILAVILGILMIAPFFYFEMKLGKDFKGIFPQIVDDEMFYYARIKDVADGHSFLSNAYLFEHKSGLPQQLFLAEYLLAQPIKLFNLNINTAHLIYNFLLPAIAFFLTYLGLYLITRSQFWSIIFSVFLFFGLYLMVFIRPVSPQFNFIFWLTQFILLWLLINNANNGKESRMLLIANIVNFGLLFYIYPYYWTFYLIFFGILIAAYFWKNRELTLKIAAIATGGLVLAIPYFYLNYLSAQLSYYTETLTRLGMIYTRFPSGIRIIFYTIFGLTFFGLALWRKIIKLDAKTLFFISGILASVIAVNQHLITGKNFEFSSHYDMVAMFFLVFTLAYLVSQYNANTRMYANDTNKFLYLKLILTIIVLAVVANGLYKYSNQVFAVSEERVYIQNYASIFEWLNKNTEKDSVIYANNTLSGLTPVYTANNVFYHRNANLFFISDSEILDRFILSNFFSAKGGSTIGGEYFSKDFIIENVRSIYGNRYIDAYGHVVQGNKLRRFLELKTEPEVYLPDEVIQKVLNHSKELQVSNFAKEIKKYQVDYLVWDKNKNPNWKINERDFSPVFENDGIIVYAVNFD